MTAPIQPLSIAHARADGGRVLVLRGDVAVDNAPDMIAAFTRAARGEEAIAVDLTDARATDASAMALARPSVLAAPPSPRPGHRRLSARAGAHRARAQRGRAADHAARRPVGALRAWTCSRMTAH